MKKTLLLGLAVAATFAASAQTAVLKEVERGLKANADSEEMMKLLAPAMTNPETADLAETWVLAGKTGFGFYQEAIMAQTLGAPFDAAKSDRAAHGLLDAFGYYLKALPLDTVINEKGKAKTKYSKEIVKTISERHDQLRNAGVMAWENQDYDGAYQMWEMYLQLPTNLVLGTNAPKQIADSLQGEMMWNQAIAMLLQGKNAEALVKFREMEPKGFIPADYYAYAMGAAQQIGDEETANAYARNGLAQPGGETNSGFLAQLINSELDKKDYQAAYDLVNKAIASTPADNAALRGQLYDILGNINENDNKTEDALANFKKAFEADPTYGKAYFDYARILYNKAIEFDEQINDPAERNQKVTPILLDAADRFKEAYKLDDSLNQIPSILYRLYYRLGANYEKDANYWKNL